MNVLKWGASNCGFDTFRIDGNVWRWSHATALMPRLGFYVGSPHINMDFYRAVPDSEVIQTPFDMHELLALIAPRPSFCQLRTKTLYSLMRVGALDDRCARLQPVYALFKNSRKLKAISLGQVIVFPKEVSSLCLWMVGSVVETLTLAHLSRFLSCSCYFV